MTTVFDTNILIDFENGNTDARQVISATPAASISRITWMEVLAGIDQADVAQYLAARSMLSIFDVIEVDELIARTAALIHFERNRAKRAGQEARKIRHSDCLIHASAVNLQATLITRNPKDFKPIPLLGSLNIPVVSPYTVSPP